MQKIVLTLICVFVATTFWAQENVKPPTDLRTHNLTKFNSSFLNPSFAIDNNSAESLSFWSRWQWQTIDTDPTTLFVNYNRQLNKKSAAGVSFFQNNTGLYLNSGALLNYAYIFKINSTTSFSVGANISIYGQDLADKDIAVPTKYMENSIIAQISPGIKLVAGSLGVSFAMENAFDYHFKLKESNTQKYSNVYTGMVSYDVPVSIGATNATLRPSIYIRDIPAYETQYGFIGFLNTDKYWGQLGYNNYYGFSVGGGVTIVKKFSLGALVELESKIKSKDPTLELVAAYTFGKSKNLTEIDEDEKLENIDVTEKEEVKVKKPKKVKKEKPEKASKKELRKKRKEQERLEAEKRAKEILEAKQAEEDNEIVKNRDEFINNAKRKDSIIDSAQKKEELPTVSKKVVPEAGEKYEEIKREDGLEPGFYIIANVYKTKRYFTLFMNDLKKKGLNPKSFLRKQNGLNYVYLAKFNTIEEARKARNSSFNGRYSERTWIFRITDD